MEFAIRRLLPSILLLLLACHAFSVSGDAPLILTEHIDFIYLRLYHLLEDTPTDISSLRQLLQEELKNSAPYKEAWDEGVEIFNQRKSTLLDGVDASIPEEYHIALIAYTSHDVPQASPFYSAFNVATRNLCTGIQVDAYPFKSFFQFLRLAIESLGKVPKFAPKANTLYRGVTVRHAFKVGTQVAFQQYNSLSQNRSVSEEYSGGITLLIFNKMDRIPTGISLGLHSKFPGEAEILLSPLQVLKVTVVGERQENGMDIFTMEPVPKSEADFKYFTSGANRPLFGYATLMCVLLYIFKM